VTLLVSSHVMDEAAHCSRLVLLREGRVLSVTSPQELRRATGEHDLEQAFIAVIRGQAVAGRRQARRSRSAVAPPDQGVGPDAPRR
jgi:ABC-type multidrug transport system ATPase subunit